jgi:hypothetical protein
VGKLRVGAANHHWFAESLDIWRYGVDLGAAVRPDERGNILVPGKLGEREHTSRICRLVIFNDELNWSAEHATRLVNFFSSELRALNFVATFFSSGSGERSYHANFEGLCGASEAGEHDHEAGQNDQRAGATGPSSVGSANI